MMFDQAFWKEAISTLRSTGFGLCSNAIILRIVVNDLVKRTMYEYCASNNNKPYTIHKVLFSWGEISQHLCLDSLIEVCGREEGHSHGSQLDHARDKNAQRPCVS